MTVLKLPTVTLCAAASVNVRATVAALSASLDQVEFAQCLLFTHQPVFPIDQRIRVIPIERLESSRAYSDFLLRGLVDHIETEHCLVVQWDGFVIDARQWDPGFLHYDYIGAPWPQFRDGHDVGNGGFSLRSRRLLEVCRDARFRGGHPEDVAICRVNRPFLESVHGLSFANRRAAELFSFERTTPDGSTFGFHGIFNMIPVLGPDRFWQIYRELDDRRTAYNDYRTLMHQLGAGRDVIARRTRLTMDLLFGLRMPTVRSDMSF
jgi:hypothetical protein